MATAPMEVMIEPRACPNCSGTVEFRGSMAQIVTVDAVVMGRCDTCEGEFEQPFTVSQSEDLIPVDDDEPKTLQGNI